MEACLLRQRPVAFVRILPTQRATAIGSSDHPPIPEDIVLEAGAIEWMGEDQLLSHPLGDIYPVEGVIETLLQKAACALRRGCTILGSQKDMGLPYSAL